MGAGNVRDDPGVSRQPGARVPGHTRCSWGVIALLVFVAVLGEGCTSQSKAPVVNRSRNGTGPAPVYTRSGTSRPLVEERRPTVHVVRPGDTLQGIAFRYRVDSRDLARWNRIENPDLIMVGQRLTLTGSGARATSTATRGPMAEPKKTQPNPAARPPDPAPRTATSGNLAWRWPASGKVVAGDSPLGGESLRILGQRGDPVIAAADGEVVYSGSGLRGYGKLIIVKHNESFLSAYAHNDTILVSEGARVSVGERIAEMGSSEAERVMLHFEIRQDGKAVDPRRFLPTRR